MATTTYNLKGKSDVVNEIISRHMKATSQSDPCCAHAKNKRLVEDEFPCDEGEKDVNLSLEDEDVDGFLELCAGLGIEPEMV